MRTIPSVESLVSCTFSLARGCQKLDAGAEKLDPEGAVLNAAVLPDQLIKPVFFHDAVPVRAGVRSVVCAGSFAVYRNAEADGLAVLCRPEHEVRIVGVKAIVDAAGGREQGCDLAFISPTAGRNRGILQMRAHFAG